MLVLLFTSLSSTWTYARQKRIDFRSGAAFAIAMIPGSILGALTSVHLSNRSFFFGFGLFMLFVSLLLLFKPNKAFQIGLKPTTTRSFLDASGQSFSYSFNLPFGIIVAFFMGYVSSLLGIGGGSVMVPTMVLLLGFPAHIASATSMFTILLSATVGSISHIALGNVEWLKLLFLAPGALVGAYIGARIAPKLPAKIILRILAILLIIVALQLLIKP